MIGEGFKEGILEGLKREMGGEKWCNSISVKTFLLKRLQISAHIWNNAGIIYQTPIELNKPCKFLEEVNLGHTCMLQMEQEPSDTWTKVLGKGKFKRNSSNATHYQSIYII